MAFKELDMKAKWFWCTLLFITLVQALFSVAFALDAAPVIPATDDQALGLANQLWDTLVNKNWAMATGPVLALIVFALRKWDTKIPKVGPTIDKALNQPAVAFLLPTVISAIAGLVTALAAHQPPLDALKAAFQASMSAVFTYVGIKKVAEQAKAGDAAAQAVADGGKQAAVEELKKP